MKKISLFISLITAAFVMTSCTEDYNADVAAPQSWEQEEMVEIPGLTLSAAADIDLETNSAATVQLVNYQVGTLPEDGEVDQVVIEVAMSEGDEKSVIEHANGAVSAEELQSLIEGYYGKAAELRTLSVTAYATLSISGEASYLVAPDAVTVNVMPQTPVIVPEYYIVGNPQGWDPANKSIVFYPIDAAAGTMSLTTSLADADGNAYFKIFSAAQMGSWDNGSYGTAIDGDTSLTGQLIENGNAIQAPSSDIYTLKLDVINNTYEMILADNQAPTEYAAIGLIGEFNSWGGDAALTEVTPHNWFIEGHVQEADGQLKFRANNDWAVSWGGIDLNDASYGTLYENGDNLVLTAGTYNIYFNDITYQTYFIAQ